MPPTCESRCIRVSGSVISNAPNMDSESAMNTPAMPTMTHLFESTPPNRLPVSAATTSIVVKSTTIPSTKLVEQHRLAPGLRLPRPEDAHRDGDHRVHAGGQAREQPAPERGERGEDGAGLQTAGEQVALIIGQRERRGRERGERDQHRAARTSAPRAHVGHPPARRRRLP